MAARRPEGTEPTTKQPAGAGRSSSSGAKPPAGGAAGGSRRASPGTSATTTSTARSTGGRSTKRATGRPAATPSGAAKPPAKRGPSPAAGDLLLSSVVAAVVADLLAIGAVGVPARTLAATALSLAGEMDNLTLASSSPAATAKALVEVMGQLKALAPAGEGDRLDDLASRRERRLAAGGSGPTS